MNTPNLPQDWQTWVDFEAEASGNGLSTDEVDALVASRMARQSLLSKSKPLELKVILAESLLRQPFGAQGAHARQLRRLVDSAGQENITIQVLPIEAGLHPGLVGGFTILEYDSEASLVLLENKVSSLFLDEPEHIEVYTRAWATLADLAHGEDESVELIAAVAERLS